MAGSVNKVILVGNLGADPEIRRTQDGRPIVNLRVATTELLARQGRRASARSAPSGTASSSSPRGSPRSPSSTSRRVRGFISKGSCRPANGRTRAGRTAIPPRSSCRTSAPRWCCSTAAPVAGAAVAATPTTTAPTSARAPEAPVAAARRRASPPWPAPAAATTWTTRSRSEFAAGRTCVIPGRALARTRNPGGIPLQKSNHALSSPGLTGRSSNHRTLGGA